VLHSGKHCLASYRYKRECKLRWRADRSNGKLLTCTRRLREAAPYSRLQHLKGLFVDH
jgi:hypothetical protein